MHRIVAIFACLLFCLGYVTSAIAQDRAAEVQRLLEERDREIKRVLGDRTTFTDEQRERLKDVINRGIDYEAMGRHALGDFWTTITAAQQREFVRVFSEIVRDQSLSNLDVYRSRVTYESVSVQNDRAHVLTTTVYKDVPTKVSYVLGFADGEWLVHDIVIDDVSTADGYARSFQSVIRRRGFDSLMDSLHRRLERSS